MNSKLTAAEWDVICAVEQFWNENKCFPSSNTISELTSLEKEDVEDIIQNSRCKKRFTALGINPELAPQNDKLSPKENRLSYEQLAVAGVILNPFDTRSRVQKLKSLGIPPATFQGWMKSRKFSTYLKDRSEEMFGDALPMMQDSLVRAGMNGNVPAIKLYMEMQGRYNSRTNESIQDFRMLVHRLIEVLQKHIRDPVVLQAISEEIRAINDPGIVRGEIEYDNHSTIIS
jgi:hypothetical protein